MWNSWGQRRHVWPRVQRTLDSLKFIPSQNIIKQNHSHDKGHKGWGVNQTSEDHRFLSSLQSTNVWDSPCWGFLVFFINLTKKIGSFWWADGKLFIESNLHGLIFSPEMGQII